MFVNGWDADTDPIVTEVDSSGKVVFQLFAQQLGLDLSERRTNPAEPHSNTHTNAVHWVAEGEYLISLRNFHQFIKIKNGEVIETFKKARNVHDPLPFEDGYLFAIHFRDRSELIFQNVSGKRKPLFVPEPETWTPLRAVELLRNNNILITGSREECYSSHPNIVQGMTSVVFGMDTADSMLSVFTLCRSLQHPDFNQEEVSRLRLILPHISRSLGVMERLRSAELSVASSLAALDQLSSGVLLLDTSGTVRFVNRAAHKILEEGDGLGLRKLDKSVGLGDLVAESVAGSQAINFAISETLRRDPFTTPHFSKRVVVPRTSGLASFSLQFSALGDHHEFGGSGGAFAAIVFIADGLTKLDVDAATLQDVYGLTPAETSVAITLLEFGSAKKVALVLNLSPHTVRSKIKSIYEKLGVDTRTRFVKLMLGLTRNRS